MSAAALESETTQADARRQWYLRGDFNQAEARLSHGATVAVLTASRAVVAHFHPNCDDSVQPATVQYYRMLDNAISRDS